MHIYQAISIFILLSSLWICDGDKPHLAKESSSESVKPHAKSADYRSDAKLKLLNSLLESKSMGDKDLQRAEKTKFDRKLQEMKERIEKEESAKKMVSEKKPKELPSWHLQVDEAVKKMKAEKNIKDFPSRQLPTEPTTEKTKLEDEESSSSIKKEKLISKSAKDLLIEEIAKMTEDNAAELAESIMISKTVTTENKDKSSTKPKAKVTNNVEISDVSKLVSYGYNLLRGCPEGDFETGGSDPGIMTSKQIFKFTFDQGKVDDQSLPQPDQVDFEPFTDITSTYHVYGGKKSYRDAVSTGVLAAGTYKSFQFSASDTLAAVNEEATSSRSVFLDNQQTLILGEVRYLHNEDNLQNDITDEFCDDVLNLPIGFFGLTASDKEVYHAFFDEWGTEVIVRAEVGLKYLIRYRANYTSAYLFARSSTESPVDAGEVGFGAAKINIDALNNMITPSSQFGTYEKELEYGTQDAPVPTKLYLEPITRALDSKFWYSRFGDPLNSATAAQQYNSLLTRQNLIEWQLEDYAEKLGSRLKDPDISVPIEWPQGTYSLPQTTSGCPVGFSSGCRTQDNEDSNNQNLFSFNIDWDMLGQFDDANNDVQTCYCSKTQPGSSIFSWMPGRYCINRKGGVCPPGFSTGHIEWDDEDNNNINSRAGVLPDGDYPLSVTVIEYCCRDDGDPEDEILLPNTHPFILYPYKEKVCQAVHGMEVQQHFVYTDDEDEDNQDKCVGEVPYVPKKCELADIELTYCYYQSKW